jgi:hypothetical protein
MDSSAPFCPIHLAVVYLYPAASKALAEPRLRPLRTAQTMARRLQAARVGTVSVL